jgi:hypothetical protein
MVDVTGAYQEGKKKLTPRTYFHGSAICILISSYFSLILEILFTRPCRRSPRPRAAFSADSSRAMALLPCSN